MKNTVRTYIDKYTRYTLVFLMGLLVVNVIWQVFSRYVLQAPSTFTDELARFLLIWVSLLGAAYFSGQNVHIAIELLPSRLSEKNQKKLQIFIKSIIIVFVALVFVIGCGHLVYLKFTFQELAPALQISMGWVYLIGPISGLLIIYYKVLDIVKLWD